MMRIVCLLSLTKVNIFISNFVNQSESPAPTHAIGWINVAVVGQIGLKQCFENTAVFILLGGINLRMSFLQLSLHIKLGYKVFNHQKMAHYCCKMND